MANLKQLSELPSRLAPGHRLCGGCGASIAVRQVLMGAGDTPVVVSSATGCLEVSTTVYPYNSWDVPFIHNAFENSAATLSGVEAAFKALKRAGKIDPDKKVKFIAFGGDGGTYDIGAYMNTGIQRSGATPYGAWTTTSEVGSCGLGKMQRRKDLTSILAAHHIPYIAQASVSHWQDLVRKAEKAINTDGPAFINVLAPCPRGWRIPFDMTVEIARLGVETNFWPLFEVENGVWSLTEQRRVKPVEEFLKPQGRFKHMFKPGNEWMVAECQAQTDANLEYLRAMVKGTQPQAQE